MTKKEIQEKLNNIPKPEYLYQRYDGIINKYEIQNNILININNANDIIDTDRQALLGKTSKNIIDLIEVGDYVNGNKVLENIGIYILTSSSDYGNNRFFDYQIKSIITKEQFEKIKFEI